MLSVHATEEEFKNAVLFLRLYLLFTLVRHEKGAFQRYSSVKPEEFKNAGPLDFSLETERTPSGRKRTPSGREKNCP